LHNVPELGDIINLKKIVSPFSKMSEDIDPEDWGVIATACAKELNAGRAVILSHGTDTLHYTSAALSFMIKKLTKPVAVIGSQRSSDRGSSDAGMNIICAAHAAIGKIAGVNVCMHGNMSDDYCLLIRGTRARKMHTSRRDAFRPINDLPLAKIWPDGKTEVLSSHVPVAEGKAEVDTRFQSKIALVKVFPGSDPGVLDYYLDNGYKGFVVEGTGLGHVPTKTKKPWTSRIKSIVSSGIPVVITSQTLYGRINPHVYSNLRELYHEAKAIPGEDMFAEVAYVKLGIALGHLKKMEDIRTFMKTNLVGEINPRSLPETFLY
ncbi:MAG: Glu-tRNA(Gln) amidotransferase subunit GatD, partial [Nanoarchaeota archaeon]|nr:Glu-tRNA(Gln) amidotransferase subunit GatD [Nanoarchaeota archaeon]